MSSFWWNDYNSREKNEENVKSLNLYDNIRRVKEKAVGIYFWTLIDFLQCKIIFYGKKQ